MPRSGPGSGRRDKARNCLRLDPSSSSTSSCAPIHLLGEAALWMERPNCASPYCLPYGLSKLGDRLRSGECWRGLNMGFEETGNYMDEEEDADKVVNEDKMRINLGEQMCHGQSLDWS